MAKKKHNSTSREEMIFDEELIVIPIRVRGIEYDLKEADGAAACTWRNSVLTRATLGPEGKPEKVGPIADTEPLLVSLCVFPRGETKHVSMDVVKRWSSKVVKTLFNKIKDISELDEDEESETVKNGQGNMTDG